MAENKELVISESLCPEFIQELAPCAEQTALLYNLCYLHLGRYPKLEFLIRQQAVETQMLFESSEAVLQKCVGTSNNLVLFLFPMLMTAVEKNKSDLAVKYLEKAKTWITDIIRAVDEIVTRYEQQNRRMAACTSKMLQEEKENQVKQTQHFEERKYKQKIVGMLQENAEEIEETETKIELKNHQLKKHIVKESRKTFSVGILSSLVPHFSSLVRSIYGLITAPGAAVKTRALNAELCELKSEKGKLLRQHYMLQVRLTDVDLKLNKHLDGKNISLQGAHNHLSQIQKILVQLKKFWEKTGFSLESLKEETFLNEFLTDDPDMKDDFLQSIAIAEKYWSDFCNGCERAQCFFNIQSKNAYNFLDTNPSTLSEDEWNKEHEFVMNKLFRISSQGSSTAAITAQQYGFTPEVSKNFKGPEMSAGRPAPRTQFNFKSNPSDLKSPPLTESPKETPTKSLPPPPPYEDIPHMCTPTNLQYQQLQSSQTPKETPTKSLPRHPPYDDIPHMCTPTNLQYQHLQSSQTPKETPTKSLPPPPPYDDIPHMCTPTNLQYQQLQSYQTPMGTPTNLQYQQLQIYQTPMGTPTNLPYQQLQSYQTSMTHQTSVTHQTSMTYQPLVTYQPQVINQSQMTSQSQMIYQFHSIYK